MRGRIIVLLIFVGCACRVVAQPPVHDGNHDVRHLLKMIPAEASTVLVVRSIAALDEFLDPSAADGNEPSSERRLRQWLQIADGLDENGAAGVVVLPSDGDATRTRRLAILLPAADAARMTVLWSPQTDQGGLMHGTVAGREGFWKESAGFVVAGPDRESVEAVLKASGNLWDVLDPSTRKRLARSPVSLWINNAGSRRSGTRESLYGLPVELLGIPPLVLDSIDRLFVTADPTPDGLLVRGSYWRTGTAGDPKVANTTAPLLFAPASEETAVALGISGEGTARHLQSACQPVLSALSLSGVLEPGRVGDFDKLFPWLVSNTDAVSIALAPLVEADTATLGIAMVLTARDNAEAVKAKLGGGVDWLRSKPFSSKAANRAMDRLVHRRSAESIDGIEVDHVKVEVDADGGADGGGSDGGGGETRWTANGAPWGDDPTIRIGAVSSDKLLISLGGGADQFLHLADFLRQEDGASIGTAVTTNVHASLATSRMVEGFVHLTQWSKLFPLLSGAPVTGKMNNAGESGEARIVFSTAAASSTATSFEVLVPKEMLPWIR